MSMSSTTPLRDLLHWEIISPLSNNMIVSQIMVLYFKVALEMIAWWRSVVDHRRAHSSSNTVVTRPCVNLLISSSVIFWPLFDTTDWSWRLNTLVPSVLAARFLYKGFWCKDPDHDVEVQTLSRSSSPSELLWGGPIQLAMVMVYLGLYYFMTQDAIILAAALGVGDGFAAPLIGTFYGRHVYQMPLAAPKSMEGSVVGVLLGTVSGCYLYLYLTGLPFLPLRVLLSFGAIAAIVEGTSPGNLDNLSIPLVLLLTMERVQELLPE